MEAKIETARTSVSYTDVNQADGQRRTTMQRFHLEDLKVHALLVTNLENIDTEAADAIGRVRIITTDTIERIRVKFEDIAREYWRTWSRHDADARRAARELAARRLPPRGWLFRAIREATEPFVPAEKILREWP